MLEAVFVITEIATMLSRTKIRRLRAASPIDQAAFMPILPWVENHAAVQFRYLNPADREEAVAVAVAHAFVSFLAIRARGKDPAEFPSAVATFAVLAVINGRRIEGGSTSRDALDPASRRRRGHFVHEIDSRPAIGWWRDAVADPRIAVADQAAFNLDFPAWLSTLTRVKRRAAELLASGYTTNAVAPLLRLCPARVSQLRRELALSWTVFHGEPDLHRVRLAPHPTNGEPCEE